MHVIDNTKKNITIIGLGFELLNIGGFIVIIWMMNHIELISWFNEDLESMSPEDFAALNDLLGFFVNILYVVLTIICVVVLFNIFIFSKLIRGKFTEKQAKNVYLYQAIWGGINLLSNQITGILYLVSGIGGFNGQKEEIDIREGI